MKPILLAALLLAATPVSAQDMPQLNRATVAFIMGASIDWAGTGMRVGVAPGDANPLINWAGNRPALMITAGAAMDAAGLLAVRHFAARTHHERLAAIGLYTAAVFRAYLGYRNIRGADIRAANMSAGLAREFQKYEPYQRR